MKNRKGLLPKIFALTILPLLAITMVGFASAHWNTVIYVNGQITSGTWGAPCIKIQKVLEGSFTNATTGQDLSKPTNQIAIASICFPSKFKMTINVTNCGTANLTNIIITDTIGTNVLDINSTASVGSVSWYDHSPGNSQTSAQLCSPPCSSEFAFHDLTWDIPLLMPGQNATLVIWIRTALNPACKYEPTGNGPLPFNTGANLVAQSAFGNLTAQTSGISINVVSKGDSNIGNITTTLPYYTPWALGTFS